MGEVYWATDARLDRQVAIKILPEALTQLIRRALRASGSLFTLLPPYLGNLGGAANRTRLLTALQMVHGSRARESEDLSLLRQAIGKIERCVSRSQSRSARCQFSMSTERWACRRCSRGSGKAEE